MKYNLKKRPCKNSNVGERSCREINEYFEGFEKELREWYRIAQEGVLIFDAETLLREIFGE